eukprot:2460800-Rhodomonas_salina.3
MASASASASFTVGCRRTTGGSACTRSWQQRFGPSSAPRQMVGWCIGRCRNAPRCWHREIAESLALVPGWA